MVICLERGSDLHIDQPMPLPLTIYCFSKIQIGFIFLVLDDPGSPRKRAVKCVCVCVLLMSCIWDTCWEVMLKPAWKRCALRRCLNIKKVCGWNSRQSVPTHGKYIYIVIRISFQWYDLQPTVLWRCWLGGRKGIRPVKNWVVGCWRGSLSGARCRLAYGPADATATYCLLLQ